MLLYIVHTVCDKWSSVLGICTYPCTPARDRTKGIHKEYERKDELSICTRQDVRATPAKLSMFHSESIVSKPFSTFSFPWCPIKRKETRLSGQAFNSGAETWCVEICQDVYCFGMTDKF